MEVYIPEQFLHAYEINVGLCEKGTEKEWELRNKKKTRRGRVCKMQPISLQ